MQQRINCLGLLLIFFSLAAIGLSNSAAQSDQNAEHLVITKGLVGVRLKERGAFLIDDFSGKEVNKDKWRIWNSNPDKAQLSVEGGKFTIRAHGQIEHNGLVSIPALKYKDVVLVARMDIQSHGSDAAWSVLHLCGGAEMGPDASVEIILEDQGTQALFSLVAWVPKGSYKASYPKHLLPRVGNQGFLVKLELNAGNNLCLTSVHDGTAWRQLDDPVELLLRNVHCEIKVVSKEVPGSYWPPQGSEDTQSSAWFDDVRLYPRPATHPVLLRLVSKDGSSPLFSTPAGLGTWPPKFQVAGEKERSCGDLKIELWTADGKTLVSSVQSDLDGSYLMPLKNAPWDIYPQGARIKLLLDDRLLGYEVEIPLRGLDGLYPNDAWDLILE